MTDKKRTTRKEKKSSVKHKTISRSGRVSPEIEQASSIASYYGFNPLPQTEIDKSDIVCAKKFSESHLKNIHPFKDKGDRFGGFLEEKIALLRSFNEKKYNSLPQPIMGFYEAPLRGNPHIKKSAEEETFNLEIIGSNKSIAEATIIETAFLILKERYPDEEFSLEINSVGDKDSITKFTRELGNFCKKESASFSKECKQAIKKDIFALFNCEHKACLDVQERAPKPMTYLSEQSRNHFKEVLEYLESLNIPYNINHSLIGSRSYCTETIFEIKGLKNGKEGVFAIGERYNSLAKKIWGKRDIYSIGIALLIHPHFVKKIKTKKEKVRAPKFFFIQFGFDAKLKSLSLIEMLRQAKIPMEQSLSKDKLTLQLTSAEKMNIPYILIMGQKEAIENSVVVRNMSTRCQETVLIKDLVSYLKKLP